MISLDELVPIMERRRIRMDIQAHPDDFYEHNLKYARKHLKHLLFADTYDYTKIFCYNINPLGLYVNDTVRCHAHIGKLGEDNMTSTEFLKRCARLVSMSRLWYLRQITSENPFTFFNKKATG
ncbi:MAG: hypothetical protein IJK81_07910 [Selenomonadaceae bacterium]|nr:hypothetical protein [Selenomonadaceae bacterium]